MTRRRIAAAALLLLLVASLSAQGDRTDDFVEAEMKRQNIPGLSLAVLENGKIIKSAGYGFANLELKTPAAPDTVYKIASVSKQFIATGIMLLVQDGRLAVDDPVSGHIADAPAAWKGITIRHLLTHTAGLVREAPGFSPSQIQGDIDVIRTAYSVPLRFAPGEKWEYSNLGYFTLAEIITRVSGRPWSEFIGDRIFKRLGMTDSRTTTAASVPRRAQGYSDNDTLREADEWAAVRPSGAFLSTVLDLAKWDAALYGDDLLTAETRRQMWTPVALNGGGTHPYGFGWMFGAVGGHKLIHHPGGMPGARANVARFVDDELTLIVLMNLDDVDIDAVVQGIANTYFTK